MPLADNSCPSSFGPGSTLLPSLARRAGVLHYYYYLHLASQRLSENTHLLLSNPASTPHVTYTKLTSGSNAFLAPTHIVPPHSLHACCLGAWLSSKKCNSSRSSTTDNVSKCGRQQPCAYARVRSYMCANVPCLLLAQTHVSNAGATSLSTRASIQHTHDHVQRTNA